MEYSKRTEIERLLVEYATEQSNTLKEWLQIINEIQTKWKQYLDKIYNNK